MSYSAYRSWPGRSTTVSSHHVRGYLVCGYLAPGGTSRQATAAKAALAIQGLAWADHHRFVPSMLCYIPGELAVFDIGGCESNDPYTETLNSAWCVLSYRVLAWRHIAVSPRHPGRSSYRFV